MVTSSKAFPPMKSSVIVTLFLLQTLTFINTASNSNKNNKNVPTNIEVGNVLNNKHNIIEESKAELYQNVKDHIFDNIYEGNKVIHHNLDTNLRKHGKIPTNTDFNKENVKEFDRNKEISRNFFNLKSINKRRHNVNKEVTNKLAFHGNNLRKYNKNEKTTENLVLDGNNDKKNVPALSFREFNESMAKVRTKREDDPRCDAFVLSDGKIQHPHAKNGTTYYNNTNCVFVISDPGSRVIELTFVDVFSIEDHPTCAYDYLEVRDGLNGYSKLLGKLCGHNFPSQLVSTGPNVWLKFHSDDTIEHEGFHINIRYKEVVAQSIPESCYKTINGRTGEINTKDIDPLCKAGSQNLEVLWTIETPEHTMIYLNFTKYVLQKPNNCDENVVEVFGSVLEASARLAKYCGSVAEPVSTKLDAKMKKLYNMIPNIMYVRYYASKLVKDSTFVSARFTAFRSLNTALNDKCDDEDEFNCDDGSCIDATLICDSYADCRLKTDEDPERCKTVTTSAISQPQTLYILITFCLIISAIFSIIIFKCIRKLYYDHKMIKELQKQSLEQRLDCLVETTLEAQKMRESEPRASLDRDNKTNEMFKKKRDSFSKRKLTSIDSDLNQESLLDLDVEIWRREVETHPIVPEDSRRQRETPDRKGRGRRIETLKEEGSKEEIDKKNESKEKTGAEEIRTDRKGRPKRAESHKEEGPIEESRSKRESDREEMEHVPFGVLDTKESSCQTRDSLLQNVPPSSSDGSGTTTSGATIAKPAPSTSEITIELPKRVPKQEVKSQKKSDSRPISTETTRSAPDVIIVVNPK